MSVSDALETPSDIMGENKFTAIYIAVLAVILAVCSVGGDNASKDMMRASISAADTYAFFQAKNIRQTSYELVADDFEIQLQDSALNESTKQLLEKKIAEYRATAQRYESEPDKGDGKKELLQKARLFEAERDLAMLRDPYFDFGQGMLQIAIVLASVSLILGGSFLLIISAVLGAAGTLFTINAYTLLVSLPFLS